MCFLISIFLCFALVPKLVPRTVDFHWYWYRILKFWYRDNPRPGYTSLSAFCCSVPSRAAFKVYSATEEYGRTSSTHAQNHQLDLHGLKKLPALGRGARLSASPLDDENGVIRTVRGRPKYTLALILICACVWSAALRWNSRAIW